MKTFRNQEHKDLELKTQSIKFILLYFLKQGSFCFGGPLAMIAMFQKDLVEKYKLISLERFSQIIALIKILPGPISTQAAIYLAKELHGKLIGFLSGLLLILPSFFMVLFLSFFYPYLHNLNWTQNFFLGMQAASLAIMADGILKLGGPYKKDITFLKISFLSFCLTYFAPKFEPIFILGFGLYGVIKESKLNPKKHILLDNFIFISVLLVLISTYFFKEKLNQSLNSSLDFKKLEVLKNFSLNSKNLELIWIFFKAGAFSFGTGLSIIPLLSSHLVEQKHWITHAQFLDAITIGQITPGPMIITSTFLGYLILGLKGALLATFFVFLPAFFNVLTWFSYFEKKLTQSKKSKVFLEHVLASVIGTLIYAFFKLCINSMNIKFFLLTLISFFLLYIKKTPTLILIFGMGVFSIFLNINNFFKF
jgi:chromate transporter